MIVGFAILTACLQLWPYTLWEYGMYWYPMFLIVPGLCFAIAIIIEKWSRLLKHVFRGFSFIGSFSFEIYLMHILLLDIFKESLNGFFPNIIYIILGIATGCFYGLLIKKVKLCARRTSG